MPTNTSSPTLCFFKIWRLLSLLNESIFALFLELLGLGSELTLFNPWNPKTLP